MTMNLGARAFHGIALLAAAASLQAEPFGYAVNSDSPAGTNFDALHRIDLATGDATLIGPTGYADVEGLAFSPEGVLYGVDDATETLIILDIDTGDGSPVNNTPGNLNIPIGPSYDFGLTFDSKGNLWLSSDTTGDIWLLDPQTGVASLLFAGKGGVANGSDGVKSAANPGALSGLAACGTTIYGVGVTGDEQLYQVPGDGSGPQAIGPLNAGLQFTDAGLDFDADGILWGIADQSTDFSGAPLGASSQVFTVDTETGAANVESQTLVGIESLAIAPPRASCGVQSLETPSIPATSRLGLAALVLLLTVAAWRFTSTGGARKR